MTVATILARNPKRLKIAAAMLAVLVLARVAIPVPPTGYWRGYVFDCLCDSDTVAEFRQNSVVIHHDPWQPLPSGKQIQSNLIGEYVRRGWATYHWRSDVKGSEADYTFRPGWLVARFTHVPTGQTYWAAREWNLPRLIKIRNVMMSNK